ncbi:MULTISPECIES: HNH endonuclease [unclassified Achromobacter]|uniref:HNH endonuclease n=1 Tax=unclassified Achromobacter TaxID=2626865 RepID=UPI000B516A09|nr:MULTISPECIES: HNH endonuclease [unclassified Achromobacter]OWT69236.1 hypothetical protein CEY05_28865 [Achromobacter sp. HZ34]OWT70641.1 hypothetical protein CEY04_27695 [Achromobacter sp. HZ28]
MSDCILWAGRRNPKGYGLTKWKGRTCGAHRLAYCKSNGITPDDIVGLVVMHTCDTPSCVNPLHLAIGTFADNNRDKAMKGRGTPGVPRKLTHAVAEEIRALYVKGSPTQGMNALARRYGLAPRSMWLLLQGKTYRAP